MQLEPQQLEELQKCYAIFEKNAVQALQQGMYKSFQDAGIISTALVKFKTFLDGNRSERKSEEHPLDSRAGNSTRKRISKHLPTQRKKDSEKPQEGGQPGTGTGTETIDRSGQLVDQPLPFQD